LTPSDITDGVKSLALYDQELLAKTGRSLRQIACRASGVDEEEILKAIQNTTVGVISVTAGEGIIPGFVGAVRDIIGHLDFRAFVPGSADVAGLAAAIDEGAEIIVMADDTIFVALNLSTRRVVENAEATGRGYGAALEGLAHGVSKRPVLVIGAGGVGTACARFLKKMGGRIGVFDCDPSRAERLAREVGGVVERDLDRALHAYTILVDACPASEIIEARHIKPTTVVSAPGVPLGLTPQARSRIESRLVHDPLQIGVATMMISAVRP
jgi:pyrrolysine biosynthesis protein PylD